MLSDLDAEAIMHNALDVAASRLEDQPRIAEVLLRQTLKVAPDDPKALSLLGLALHRLGQFKESIEYFSKVLGQNPGDADVYNNMALSYASMEEYEKSTTCLEQALTIKPDQYLFLNNLALQYRQTGEVDRAIYCFNRALAICKSPMVLCNLGSLFTDLKLWDLAEKYYTEAIDEDPSLAAPHVFISYIYGYRGKWEKAFREYQWRFLHFDQLKYYNKVYDWTKSWCGEPLDGKTIILYGEQGWGDQIQYIRYVSQLKKMGAHTIVHCSKSLESLFARLTWVDEVISLDITNITKEDLPDHDFHCSLISLPFLLKDFHPVGAPYITPPSVLRMDDIEEYRGLFRVGIAWAGSPAHPNDQYRSMHLKELESLQMDGVRLFNLQVGSSKRFYPASNKTIDFAEGGEKVRMVDMVPLIKNYDDTASVISGLNLIISVDTSIVHLAGAMGIPCWVLLPYNSDWRWGVDGDHTDWYDSLELFRQEKVEDWGSTMERVRVKLENILRTDVWD